MAKELTFIDASSFPGGLEALAGIAAAAVMVAARFPWTMPGGGAGGRAGEDALLRPAADAAA